MAKGVAMLVTCSECGRSVSDKAIACPNCGNPIQQMLKEITARRENVDAQISTDDRGVKKVFATKIRKFRRRGVLRAPLTVLIPTILLLLLLSVPAILGFVYSDCSRNDGDFSALMFVCFVFAINLLMNISLLMGRSWPRFWFTLGMVAWIVASVFNPFALLAVVVIVAAWCLSMYSKSASRWFAAHKRLSAQKERKANAVK